MITAGLDFVGDQRANSRWSKACNPRVSNWTKLSRIYLVVFVVATIKSRSKPIIFRNILSHIWLDGEESGKESTKCDRRKRMRVGALTYFKLPKITPMRLERVIVKLPHVNSHTHATQRRQGEWGVRVMPTALGGVAVWYSPLGQEVRRKSINVCYHQRSEKL